MGETTDMGAVLQGEPCPVFDLKKKVPRINLTIFL